MFSLMAILVVSAVIEEDITKEEAGAFLGLLAGVEFGCEVLLLTLAFL